MVCFALAVRSDIFANGEEDLHFTQHKKCLQRQSEYSRQGVLMSTYTDGRIECFSKCLRLSQCQSVNFNASTSHCQLHDGVFDENCTSVKMENEEYGHFEIVSKKSIIMYCLGIYST